MKISVLKEERKGDLRVSLTPAATRRLIASNHTVMIETGAGIGSGFSDDAYQSAGASLAVSRQELYKGVDILTFVKRPLEDRDCLDFLPGETILIGFLDPFFNDGHLSRYQNRNALALECIPKSAATEKMDALAAMGKIAGDVAFEQAKNNLVSRNLPINPNVLILGAGNSGLAAAEAAAENGFNPILCAHSTPVSVRDAWKVVSFEAAQPIQDQQAQVAQIIRHKKPSLIIATAHRRASAQAPVLINEETIAAIDWPVVVEDLTGKAGGNTPYTKIDAVEKPTPFVLIHHRSNYPSQRPEQASEAFAGCMEHIIGELDNFLRTNPAMRAHPFLGQAFLS